MIKKQRRIPTILGLLMVLAGIGAATFLVENFKQPFGQATPLVSPQEVKITNLGPTSLTVSWLTAEKTQGWVVFGQEKSSQNTAFDQRDSQEEIKKYFTHYVQLKNLKPSTTYYFKIISQGKTFDQNGQPYQAKTLPSFLGLPSQAEPAYGTVLNPDNTPCQGAIVYLYLDGALPLSALTKPSGHFLIPLNLSIRQDLTGPFIPKEKEKEQIIIRAQVDQMAKAITDSQNDSPIPTIILGKSYDFQSQKLAPKEMMVEKKLPQKILGAQKASDLVEILFPKKDNAPLLDPRPLFKGQGVPRQKVTIQIKSPLLTEEVTVNPNGQWFFRPKKALSPGKHTLTVTTQDRNGKEITLTRKFLILKSGSQVLGEATPSATLTPTPSPTLKPTTTPVPLSPTPTQALSPTPSLTPGFFTPTVHVLKIAIFLVLTGIGFSFLI